MLGQRARRILLLLGMIVLPALVVPAPVRADAPAGPGAPVGEALLDDMVKEKPALVEFDGRTLFYVRARVGTRSAADRARSIERRIQEVADAKEPPGPLRVVEGHASDIFLGDRFIASITDAESGNREERPFYARAVGVRLEEAIRRYRADRTPEALARSWTKALLLTVALVAFLLGLAFVRSRLGPKLASGFAALLSRMRIQHYALIGSEAQGRLVALGGWILRFGLVAVALLAWLDAVAHLFPWTRGPADKALRFTLGATGSVLAGVVDYLPNLVYIALFLAVGWTAQGLNRIFFRAVRAGAIQIPGFFPDWSRTTSLIVTLFIGALVAVAVYPYLPGSGSSAFQSIGLLLGAMISLGSGSSVANAISGIVLTYMRPFQVGDFVRIADVTGTVSERGLLAVKLVTIRSEHVTLASSTVLASQILNFSAEARTSGVAIRTSVTIGYDTPWRKVHELLLAAAGKTAGVRREPAPWVIQSELHDFYVRYELDAYVEDPARQHFILSELNQNVQDVFFAAGVEILSPHYAQLRDGSRPAIPPEHLPQDATGRAFPVELRGGLGGGTPG